jgi:hypothetical protein
MYEKASAPLAPGLFSHTTGTPKSVSIRLAMNRDTVSEIPPGEAWTMSLISREG